MLVASNRLIELLTVDQIGFNGVWRFSDFLIEPIDQPGEARESSRIGNACAAEKHHPRVLVRLQEALRNVGAVANELQDQPALKDMRDSYLILD